MISKTHYQQWVWQEFKELLYKSWLFQLTATNKNARMIDKGVTKRINSHYVNGTTEQGV